MRKFELLDIQFQQDNALAHTSSQALAAIQNTTFKELPHLLYSQDLAPSNYYLLPKIQKIYERCRFSDDENVICNTNYWLKNQD